MIDMSDSLNPGQLRLALLGADDPLGQAILRLITERDVEVGEISPLSLAEGEGCATVRGEELPLFDVASFDWSRPGILINATRSPAAHRFEEDAATAGWRVIGLGPACSPIGRIAVEGALAVAIQRVLEPIRQHVALSFASGVAMLPVALAGEPGVAELINQTRALFAMESPEPEVFPLQIAFNLIPQVGPMLPGGDSQFEQDVRAEVHALLGDLDLPFSLTAVMAPLFYGAAMTLHVGTRGDVRTESVRGWLSDWPGLTLMDTPLPGGVATPVSDALDSESVFISRLRADGNLLSMWTVIDLIRLEAARIVDSLENSIET